MEDRIGWIHLYRDIMEMRGYFGHPFSRTDCWIDLLLLAEWRESREFYIRGNLVRVERGQVAMATRELAKRWNLARRTVLERLTEMVTDGRIEIRPQKGNLINIISVVNYEKYQDSSPQNSPQSSPQSSPLSIRREEDKKIKKETPKGVKKSFSPPTIDDVRGYADSKGYAVDAERFCDYYASNGWRVGRNPMKDWQAAVRQWAARDRTQGAQQAQAQTQARVGGTASLGVWEYRDAQGRRTYGTSGQVVPEDAPQRPSPAHWWSDASGQWERML